MATRLPVTWLPLSQYANYFEEVMRFKGYQARSEPAGVLDWLLSFQLSHLMPLRLIDDHVWAMPHSGRGGDTPCCTPHGLAYAEFHSRLLQTSFCQFALLTQMTQSRESHHRWAED